MSNQIHELKFGKYAGSRINDPRVPTDYLEWMSGDGDDGRPRVKSEGFRSALLSEIERRKRSDNRSTPEAPGSGSRHDMPRTDMILNKLSEILDRISRIESRLSSDLPSKEIPGHLPMLDDIPY